MGMLTLFIFVLVFATIGALVLGIASMVSDGVVSHRDSEHWMAMRVFLQVMAVVVLVGAVYAAT